MFYARHNHYASLIDGKHGFANTWAISRFKTRAERDAFVKAYSNRKAEAITRDEAKRTFNSNYLSIGKDVPKGGLFGEGDDTAGYTNFWNEDEMVW